MAIVARRFLQIFIGGVLLASALGKSLDLPGFVEVIETYRALPDAALLPVALTVTGLEFILSIWLISGRHLHTAALTAMGVNAGYTVWMTVSLLRGLELENCGCFGVFFPQPLRWYSPLEDLVLAGMCYVLWQLTRKIRDSKVTLRSFPMSTKRPC